MDKKLTTQLKDLLTHKKHGNLYDFICDNYYLLSKEDLKDLCKEAFALLYTHSTRIEIESNEEKAQSDLHIEYLENLQEYTTIFED